MTVLQTTVDSMSWLDAHPLPSPWLVIHLLGVFYLGSPTPLGVGLNSCLNRSHHLHHIKWKGSEERETKNDCTTHTFIDVFKNCIIARRRSLGTETLQSILKFDAFKGWWLSISIIGNCTCTPAFVAPMITNREGSIIILGEHTCRKPLSKAEHGHCCRYTNHE